MRYYASHLLWHAGQNRLFRMQRIGIEEESGEWRSMEPLETEMRQTVWLSGLMVLAPSRVEIRDGESFADFCTRVAGSTEADAPLKAFHVVPFDLATLSFVAGSRLVNL